MQAAIDRLGSCRQLAMHSVGGDSGINDAMVRQSLRERGILAIDMPTSVEPIYSPPDPEEIAAILAELELTGRYTAWKVSVVYAETKRLFLYRAIQWPLYVSSW